MSDLTEHLQEEKQTILQNPEKRKRGRPRKNPQPSQSQQGQSQTRQEAQADIKFTPCPATAMIYKMVIETAFCQILLKGKKEINMPESQCLEVSGAIRFILDHYAVNVSPLTMAFSAVAFNLAGVYMSQVLPAQKALAEQEANTIEATKEALQNA